MTPALATVVIPNYNGLRFLPRLMETLFAQTDDRFAVTVVDDASKDASVEYLRDAWPRVRVMVNDRNLGFARSCNAGMRAAETPLVVLLNNDTHLDPHWFAEGVKPFEQSDVAAVASLVLLADPPHLVDTAGDVYSIAGGAAKRAHLQPRATVETLAPRAFSPCGASAFYRRAAVAEAGWLDEAFESYYEDVDLGFRLAWAGHSCVFAPRSICYHHLSSSYSPTGWRMHFNSSRNAEIVWWANLPSRLRRRYLFAHLCFLALQGGVEVLRGRTHSFVAGKWAALRMRRHILEKRRKIEALARVSDADIDALLVHDWWGLLVAPRLRKMLRCKPRPASAS